MKVKLLAAALLASTLLLAGCNNAKQEDKGGEQKDDDKGETVKSTLSFLQNNQIRFDIMNDDLGLSFKYGDDAIVSKTPLAFAEKTLSATGELAKETLNFIIAVEKDANSFTLNINPGILKESLNEYLADFTTSYLKEAVGGKAYIAISEGGKEATWTKGLSAELDEKIQARINILK